jgi:uncharacterized protein YdeI (YjbR/CyaY-like superfamily)
VRDLPAKRVLVALVKKAAALNEQGAPRRVRKATPKPPPEPTPDFAAALANNRKASRQFEAFSPSHRREYVDWIAEAKQEQTRARRIAQAVEWLAEGKARNWKYENC